MEYSPSLGIQVEEEMKIGSYEGDGTADRIIDIGFTPKVIWIYSIAHENTASAVATTIDYSSLSSAAIGWAKNNELFQGIVPNGFKTGTNEMGYGLNEDRQIYFWIATP